MKKGFTLAEVALTLALIGVIAAMTIPTMIHNTNKKSTIEQLKKSTSTLNQAVYNSTLTAGLVNTWTWDTDDGILNIIQNYISPRLSVGYKCSGSVGPNSHCTYNVKMLNGGEQDINQIFKAKSRVLLNDGSLVAFTDANTFISGNSGEEEGGEEEDIDRPTGSVCTLEGDSKTLCGVFMVDVNGNKKPNMVGKDVFFLGLYLSGAVMPYGVNEGDEFIEENCSGSKDKDSSGTTCAAKITRGGWDVCYSNCGENESPYPVLF